MASWIEGTEEVKKPEHRTEKNKPETGLLSSFSWWDCEIVSDYEVQSLDASNNLCPVF